jgi:hypothetical protein
MSETQERFRPDELRRMAFTCKCGLEIIVDIEKASLNAENPPRCPSCGESLKDCSGAVFSYKAFYTHASKLKLSLVAIK